MERKQLMFTLDKESSQLLKGCAILMVLLGHTHYILAGGAGGVALFLILSGYGLNTAYEQNGLDRYWRKRIRKVWLPYFIVGLFDVVALAVCQTDRIICTLIGLDMNRIADITMWFISFIMLWYVAFYCFAWIARNMGKSKRRILVALGLFAASFFFKWLAQKQFWHLASGAARYIFFFPLGVLLDMIFLLVCVAAAAIFRSAYQLFLEMLPGETVKRSD